MVKKPHRLFIFHATETSMKYYFYMVYTTRKRSQFFNIAECELLQSRTCIHVIRMFYDDSNIIVTRFAVFAHVLVMKKNV